MISFCFLFPPILPLSQESASACAAAARQPRDPPVWCRGALHLVLPSASVRSWRLATHGYSCARVCGGLPCVQPSIQYPWHPEWDVCRVLRGRAPQWAVARGSALAALRGSHSTRGVVGDHHEPLLGGATATHKMSMRATSLHRFSLRTTEGRSGRRRAIPRTAAATRSARPASETSAALRAVRRRQAGSLPSSLPFRVHLVEARRDVRRA